VRAWGASLLIKRL
jgi:hypothetical protein